MQMFWNQKCPEKCVTVANFCVNVPPKQRWLQQQGSCPHHWTGTQYCTWRQPIWSTGPKSVLCMQIICVCTSSASAPAFLSALLARCGMVWCGASSWFLWATWFRHTSKMKSWMYGNLTQMKSGIYGNLPKIKSGMYGNLRQNALDLHCVCFILTHE